jgi:hypothetical protein
MRLLGVKRLGTSWIQQLKIKRLRALFSVAAIPCFVVLRPAPNSSSFSPTERVSARQN